MSTERADLGAPPSWFVRRTGFIRTRPGVDWLIALAFAGAAWWMGNHDKELLELLDAGGRRAAYQTLAGLSGTLMGLTVTTTGLILANVEKPIPTMPKGLPGSVIPALGRSLFSSIRAWGYLCAASVTLILVDTNQYQTSKWSNGVIVALASLGALRVSRAIYWLAKLFDSRAQAIIK